MKIVLISKNVPFTWEKYHGTKEEYADLHDTVRRRKERNMLEVKTTPVLSKKW